MSAFPLWPVDKVTLASTFGIVVLMVLAARSPTAWLILAGHLTVVVLIAACVLRPSAYGSIVHHWYALLYVPLCYKQIPFLIHALHVRIFDSTLAAWDLSIWNVNPTVWMERLQTPWFTELMQIVYSMFIPALVLLGLFLWRRGQYQQFRYYVFLLVSSFLLCFVGYVMFPARGPRFFLDSLQHIPLTGLAAFRFFRGGLDRLEGVQYDCFPSGHVSVLLVACYISRTLSKKWLYAFVLFFLAQSFSIIYLRYHYTVDLFAGLVLATGLLLLGPRLYGLLGGDSETDGIHRLAQHSACALQCSPFSAPGSRTTSPP